MLYFILRPLMSIFMALVGPTTVDTEPSISYVAAPKLGQGAEVVLRFFDPVNGRPIVGCETGGFSEDFHDVSYPSRTTPTTYGFSPGEYKEGQRTHWTVCPDQHYDRWITYELRPGYITKINIPVTTGEPARSPLSSSSS